MKKTAYIFLRWVGIVCIPILIVSTIILYKYDPCAMCSDGKHRHTMGPWLGIYIGSFFWGVLCVIGMCVEFIYRAFKKS